MSVSLGGGGLGFVNALGGGCGMSGVCVDTTFAFRLESTLK